MIRSLLLVSLFLAGIFFGMGWVDVRPATAAILWTEDAENGMAYVIDHTDSIYDLIQSDFVSQGANAFHLARPNPMDDWFELDTSLTIESDTKLFFQSRLSYATTTQVARVQVSTDGGTTWPTDIFSQAGDNGSGDGAFGLKERDLSSYAGQEVRIRFLYDYTGGSYYDGVTTNVGWRIDDIQIADRLSKTQYSIGDPTAYEQSYLEYVNRARADALVEANRLANETDSDILATYSYFGIDVPDIVDQFTWYVNNGHIEQHAQPLSFNEQLLWAAQLHTQDQYDNQFQGHVSSNDPPEPFQSGFTLVERVDAVGYNWTTIAENVFSYADSVAHGHAGFDVDWGNVSDPSNPVYNPAFADQGMQNPAGHRLNLHHGDYKEAGIGVINGTNGSVGPQVVTQDLGSPGAATFVTGVVYEDLNGNDFYDIGEGRSDVQVDVDGSGFFAVSSDSGGYSVPVTGDGLYNVTFSGGGYADYFTTANVVNGDNVKIDYLASTLIFAEADFDTDGDVDENDLATLEGAFGSGGDGDTDDDGDTDGVDFLTWQRQYTGNLNPLTSLAVPEPGSRTLLLGMTIGLMLFSNRIRVKKIGLRFPDAGISEPNSFSSNAAVRA